MQKKTFLSFLFLCAAFYSLTAQQKEYTKPALSNPDSWSLILLPDPQSYIKFDYNQPIFELMTAWIARNAEPLRIGLTLCTGDLVEQNALLVPNGVGGNQTGTQQWTAVSRAFNRLDGITPYILATGNHDFGIVSAENRRTQYDKYFPAEKNPLSQKMLRAAGTNADGEPSLINAAYEFVSPQGQAYLVVVLEFAPRDETLEWAKKLVAQDKYAKHRVILLTHTYISHLKGNSKRIENEGYKLSGPNWGEAVWQKLVQPSRNIGLVLCGHIAGPDDWQQSCGYSTDKNVAGKTVHQMMFDTQALGGGWNGNGGDGWLRILEFLPDGKTVKVRTFSPFFAASPTTQPFAWNRESFNEFSFEWE
ncbi:MAG: metallophosphoesterase [Dysgonamonadaceae bacterium]|jgi:hypothetical protein|nr:metallophosphoesterase [Dysgonamonadaceae bacterium]